MISTALLKEQLKRTWPFMLISILAYVLLFILPIYLQAGGVNNFARARGMLELLSMQNPFMLAATVLIPFGIVMLSFSNLFSVQKAAAYFVFTDSKGQLFWTKVINGLILMVVPLLILSALMFIRVRYPSAGYGLEYAAELFARGISPGNIITTFPVIAAFFLRVTMTSIFYFALFLLAASVSGNRAIATGIAALLAVAPMLIHRLIIQIGLFYVRGYYPVDVLRTETIVSYVHPLAWAWNWGEASQAAHFFIYFGIAVAMLAIACLCFTNRKVERAGETVVFRPLKSALVFVLSIAGMIALGGYLSSVLVGRWFLYYGFVLGFALIFCVAQMKFGGSFNIVKKIKWIMPMIGVVAVLYGGMLLVTSFGMRGYTHYVPAETRVTGVYVSIEGRPESADDFDRDQESVAGTISLHERILDIHYDISRRAFRDLSRDERSDIRDDRRDHRSDMRDAHWESITGGGIQFSNNNGEHLYITYLLNNGDRVYRRYALPSAFFAQWVLGLDPVDDWAMPEALPEDTSMPTPAQPTPTPEPANG